MPRSRRPTPSQKTDLVRACDRCYASKEKCRIEADSRTCVRCAKLGHTCTTARASKKPGRRPATQGTITWVQDAASSPDRKTAKKESPPEIACEDIQKCSEVQCTDQKLYPICPLKAPGFSEKRMADILFSKDCFTNVFVVGPTFTPDFSLVIKKRLITSPTLLMEAYLALFGAVVRARTDASTVHEEEMSWSVIGLQKLRSLHITQLKEATNVLTLGLVLSTFDMLTLSSSTHLICRYTLSLIKPWYPKLWPNPNTDVELLCLIFIDTAECLVRREIPVIQHLVRDQHLVDRLLGLCPSFLPVLYNVCQCGYLSQQEGVTSRSMFLRTVHKVSQDVQCWYPSPPPKFEDLYSNDEVITMLAQAHVYKAMALLILHRLQHPFGTEDQIAVSHAQAIIHEASFIATLSVNKLKSAPVMLPVMVAAFEMTTEEDRQLATKTLRLRKGDMLSSGSAKVLQFVQLVWQMRDKAAATSWFDLVQQAPPFSVLL